MSIKFLKCDECGALLEVGINERFITDKGHICGKCYTEELFKIHCKKSPCEICGKIIIPGEYFFKLELYIQREEGAQKIEGAGNLFLHSNCEQSIKSITRRAEK